MFILVFQPEVLFGSLFTLNTNLGTAGLEITESLLSPNASLLLKSIPGSSYLDVDMCLGEDTEP